MCVITVVYDVITASIAHKLNLPESLTAKEQKGNIRTLDKFWEDIQFFVAKFG